MERNNCIMSINVNNHLGYLHNKYTNNWNPKKILEHEINFKTHDNLPNVCIGTKVIPYKLAIEVRDFIHSVKFDNKVELMNDVNNKPLDSAHFVDASTILDIYENKTDDPKEWLWEKYRENMWRLAPKSLNAFIGSPIAAFITILENNIRAIRNSSIDFSKLKKGTWVIQRLEKGMEMGIHSDACGRRAVSFVYFLTTDNWTNNDGGGLCVLNTSEKKFIRIQPTFNTLAMWAVNNDYSGLHYIEEVFATNDKPRISLVGFFDA